MKQGNVSIFVPHLGCSNQCSFCNQRSISGQQTAPGGREAAMICEQALQQGKADDMEIAFFGGSFTAIPQSYMLELLHAVQPYIACGRFRGIRISTRPDAITEEILQQLLSCHVTAIELGVQSMDDEVLRQNRRGHTAADVQRAVALIRRYPFELGLQFMPGLCGDTPERMRYTAEAIINLQPNTVRIYPTLVLEGTELAQWYRNGTYKPLSLDAAVDLCADFLLLFESKGIRVIRMGLHASETMEAQLLAGPYHPAFRQLCESRILYRKALSLLQRTGKDKEKAYHLFCSTQSLSAMNGQNRENVENLKKQGWDVRIKPDVTLQGRDLSLREYKKKPQRRDNEYHAVKNLADSGL